MKNFKMIALFFALIAFMPMMACRASVETVNVNDMQETMEEYLSHVGITVDVYTKNVPKIFDYIIISNDYIDIKSYQKAHPEDGVWVIGNRPDNARSFIFTNNPTPDPKFFK